MSYQNDVRKKNCWQVKGKWVQRGVTVGVWTRRVECYSRFRAGEQAERAMQQDAVGGQRKAVATSVDVVVTGRKRTVGR